MSPHTKQKCCEKCKWSHFEDGTAIVKIPKCNNSSCPCHLPAVMEKVDKQIGNAVRRLGLEQKCTCASFFTVRGVHKKDCPAYQQKSRVELIEEIVGEFFEEHGICLDTSTPHNFTRVREALISALLRISDASMDAVEVDDGRIYSECCDKCKSGDYDGQEEWHDYCADEKCSCHATTFQRKRTLFVK